MLESWVPLIWKEMDNAQKEIDKCPFCGCTTVLVSKEKDWFKAICVVCSAQMFRGTLPELIEAWNRRDDDGD